MSRNCSEFISLLSSSLKSSYTNITYYNDSLLELKNCNDFDGLCSKLAKQGIQINSTRILPKTEIGIYYNDKTKTLLVFPTCQMKISEK